MSLDAKKKTALILIEELNKDFKLNEGCDIVTYNYRIDSDPDCMYGSPKLINPKSSKILSEYKMYLDLIDVYNKQIEKEKGA